MTLQVTYDEEPFSHVRIMKLEFNLLQETVLAELQKKVIKHLENIYPNVDHESIAQKVIEAAGISESEDKDSSYSTDENEVVLITYGDSILDETQKPLEALAEFIESKLADVISTVHILPFYPSSSDGGFSVIDYYEVSSNLGDWEDIAKVAPGKTNRKLMADLILNHGSAQSEWFKQFIAGEKPGCDYFVTSDPDNDLSNVTRPRTHDLLLPVDTPTGERHVWCTFSHDQVDFDFGNPDVLIEFTKIIDFYVSNNVTRLRLDAVAYLWKELGSKCIHLEQTHEVVKLFNTLLSHRAPDVLLISETNVPHEQNVSYFGNSDEAHVIYNFSLVPLVLHAVLANDPEPFIKWAENISIPEGNSYFLNFLASHDGMGVRPAEGLLTDDQLSNLVKASEATGGTFSPYSSPEGEKPYELNASLYDVLAGRDGKDIDKFLLAHSILLTFAGIPAIYIHSLLGTPGDLDAVKETGIKRNINRSRLNSEEVIEELESPDSYRAAMFKKLCEMIKIRRSHDSFDPKAEQDVFSINDKICVIKRSTNEQTIFAIHNVSDSNEEFKLDDLSLNETEEWKDLLGNGFVKAGPVELKPFEIMWLCN